MARVTLFKDAAPKLVAEPALALPDLAPVPFLGVGHCPFRGGPPSSFPADGLFAGARAAFLHSVLPARRLGRTSVPCLSWQIAHPRQEHKTRFSHKYIYFS